MKKFIFSLIVALLLTNVSVSLATIIPCSGIYEVEERIITMWVDSDSFYNLQDKGGGVYEIQRTTHYYTDVSSYQWHTVQWPSAPDPYLQPGWTFSWGIDGSEETVPFLTFYGLERAYHAFAEYPPEVPANPDLNWDYVPPSPWVYDNGSDIYHWSALINTVRTTYWVGIITTPEPTTVMLLGLGGLVLLRKRRK